MRVVSNHRPLAEEQKVEALVIATGGDTELLYKHSLKINKIEKELTLSGISLLYRNIFN